MGSNEATALWSATFKDRFKELVDGTPYRVLSDKLNISKSTVSAYLSGERSPKVPALTRIAEFYGVDTLWLMGMDVPKYKNETPAGEGEGMSEDRAYLLNKVSSLSDEDVRALRTIVDQVLSLRER